MFEKNTSDLKHRIEANYAREDLPIQIGTLDESGGGTVPQPNC